MKQCSNCGEIKSFEFFDRYSGKKDGHRSRCKECRKKISTTHSKAVLQYTKSGDFVAEYASGTEASTATGVAPQGISKACRMQRATAGGYIWKFKNN